MSLAIVGIVVTTVPLLLLGIVSHGRWRLPLAAVLVAAAFAVAGSKGIVMVEDLWVLPLGIGMTDQLILLLMWCLLGSAARAVGPVTLPGPTWLTALLMGAGMGEVPAATMLSLSAKTPKGAARLALTAAAGAMLGRLGDPAMLILLEGDPAATLAIVPLAVVLAVVVRPRAEDVHAWDGRFSVHHAALLAVILAACVPGLTLWAIAAGIGLFVFWSREEQRPLELATPAWQLAALALAVLAIGGGAAEQAALGLELSVELLGDWAAPLLVGVTALLSALTDGLAMAVFCQGIIDRSMSLDSILLVTPMTAGVAVGGLGPLIAAGAIKVGWRLWLLQVVVAMIWGWLWAIL